MKQLFFNDKPTTLFFNQNEEIENICHWVNFNIHLFELNEQNSCVAIISTDNEIVITGDEDLKVLTIEEITPINCNLIH